MKRLLIDKLLSDTYPDEEITTEKTEEIFPEVSADKTQRIINSGLIKLKNAMSDAEPNVKATTFVGAQIMEDRKKVRIAPIVTAAACALLCIVSAGTIFKKSSKPALITPDEEISDNVSDEDPEEIIPGLEEVCEFPEFTVIGSPVACSEKIVFNGMYSETERPYGILKTYDLQSGRSEDLCVLSRVQDENFDSSEGTGITDFFISDDGKYLYVLRPDVMIKYDNATGETVKALNIEDVIGFPLKICRKPASSDFYIVFSSGMIYCINDQLEIAGKHDLSAFPEPEFEDDYDMEYSVLDAVIVPDGSLYLLISYAHIYYSVSSESVEFGDIVSESELVIKYDRSFSEQYVVPNSELRKVDAINSNLTVLRNGRAAVIGSVSHAGVISPDSPVIEKIYEMTHQDEETDSICFDTETCDYIRCTESEIQLWNIGDDDPAAVYRYPENDLSFTLNSAYYTRPLFFRNYHIYNDRLYYYSASPCGEYVSVNSAGTVINRNYDYSSDNELINRTSKVNRYGEIYYTFKDYINGYNDLNFIRSSDNTYDIFSEYDCDDDKHTNIFINSDINILSQNIKSEGEMELHAPDGRKICTFIIPDGMRKFLASRSMDNGEKICYININNKACCYDTETGISEEISVINDNLVFYDYYETAVRENAEKGIWLDIVNIFNGGKYDICMRSGKKLYGYSIETDELTVIADNLDSFDCLFTGFTVSEDETIYCTVYGKNKLYRICENK